MEFDPSTFHKSDVVGTCSLWNVLASNVFFAVAREAGCSFCITSFVQYECLVKPRKKPTPCDIELCGRLKARQKSGEVSTFSIDLEDLQQIEVLRARKRLGMGELASMAFAVKTRQAVLTDDRGAQKLSREIMAAGIVQSTPQLFGWLFFISMLSDGQKDQNLQDHPSMNRHLASVYEQMYRHVLHARLLNTPRL